LIDILHFEAFFEFQFQKAIKKNTRMVILNHGSNVIGTVQPLAEIGRINGVYFAVDASQTAGAQKIYVQEMNIDLLAFTGHKCLMGPTGINGSYTGEDVPIRVTCYGGTGVRSAQRTHLEEFHYRMENIVGVAGFHAGQKWTQKEGMENIHQREISLWDRLRKGLQQIDGVITYCAYSIENHNAVLSFNIEGWEAADVGTMLDVDYNIACRTGLQCAPLVHEHR
jgi:cysteine desulfurase/selenocysteine lyase